MKYLTVEDLLALHALLIQKYGGSTGIRDVGRLEAAIATQYQAVFGTELYPSPHQKAAALLRGIIADYPLGDGNKRTGTLAALTLLECNGHFIVAEKGELEDLAVSVATDHLDINTIAAWLETHSRQAGKG